MTQEQLSPLSPVYGFPRSPESQAMIRDRVARRIADYLDASLTYFIANNPILAKLGTWREQLDFFRHQGIEYWVMLAAEDRGYAEMMLRAYGALVAREAREGL